ncbi:MAG: DUF4270 domain-containing protein [Bacteroidaceae bacterium]|nr:DUF4270 domain-containing protein [Bacteroidaceae bacterium]
MKIKQLLTMTAMTMALLSCDDNTDTLGVDMMPVGDLVTNEYKTYDVNTQSYAVGDSVLARTDLSYLGKYTDAETGTTVKSDFLCQFNCGENFDLPEKIEKDSCVRLDLRLFISDFVGDSLASFKISVYELNKQLDPEEDYYTNIDPEKFCDMSARPLATKWYTISDRTITDSTRWSSDYSKNIRVSLPTDIGTKILRDYRSNPEHFANTAAWLESGNPCSKGLYFKLEYGDGAMAYIDIVQFNIYFNYYDEDYKKDTLGVCSFAATDAVVKASRFENSNLDRLMDDREAAYLKTPAGIFTLATIPIEEINAQDTINSAKLTFTRYNDTTQEKFKLSIPQTVLLVRLDDYLDGFFENYQISNSKDSYLTTFDSSTNTYVFNNVARLLTTMVEERRNGKASENWNKVLLIPVKTTKDSSGNIVKLNHDFNMGYTKLVGGESNNVKMEVLYSKFK